MRTIFRRLTQSLIISILSVIVLGCSAYAANIDATVPASLPITVSSDGVVKTATNAAIHNYCSSPIFVSSINVTAENGWSLATKDAAASASIGAKVISMGFTGSWMDASGTVDTSDFDRISSSGTLNLSYDAKTPGVVTAESSSTAATATFVVGLPSAPTMASGSSWYKSTENRNTITKITFMDSYTPTTTVDETWNADVNNTGDIKCYRAGTEIIIVGNGTGKIQANADSSYMFSSTNSYNRFEKLISIENLSLLDTSNVTRMGAMFTDCSGLTTLNLSGFDTSKVTFMFSMFTGCSGLTSLDLSSFDTSKVTDMESMFFNCSGLTSLDLSSFDTSEVTTMHWMFYNCSGLTSIDVSRFNTSKVTDMGGMFYNCSGLTSIDVFRFNTSKVTSMGSMFYNCSGLTSLDLSSFDTSKVTSMYWMFYGCSGLKSIDLSKFDTSNITDMSCMFYNCSGLTSLDLSSFDTSQVTTMADMFYHCSGLPSLDLSSFDTSQVTTMADMFYRCSGLPSLDLSSFDTSQVTTMTDMFYSCSGLTTIYASDKWNTNRLTQSRNMFKDCFNLNGAISYNSSKKTATYANWTTGYLTYKALPATLAAGSSWYKSSQNRNTITKITFMDSYTPASYDEKWAADVNGTGDITCYRTGTEIIIAGNGSGKIKANADSSRLFSATGYNRYTKLTSIENLALVDTSNVTDMSHMFYYCSGLTSLDLSNFNTANVTDMRDMFTECKGLTSLDLSNFNTAKVTNMNNMFYYCSGLRRLDLSNFNTANVTDMSFMFSECQRLPSLDLSNFDTANVPNMRYMFQHCKGLTSLDLSNFDTANVINMSYMFYSCSSLTSLDLSNFNTANVTDMGDMFYGCSGLTNLDVSKFDTANVASMYDMFYGCSGLTSLDLSNFNTANVTDMYAMFYACDKLKTIYAGEHWNTDKVTSSSRMFTGCTVLQGDIAYNSKYADKTYAKTSGGYLTYKAASTKTLSLNIDPNSGAVTSYDVSTNPISRFRAFLDWSDTANVA